MKFLRITLLVVALLFVGTIAGCLEGQRADWPDPSPDSQTNWQSYIQEDDCLDF